MGHHHHDHAHHGEQQGALRFALVLTATYMVVEAIGGMLTGSLALLADAGHMLSDVGALSVALVANRIAARPPDGQQTMGYQRAEVLGAALNAGALVVIAFWILTEAVQRLAEPREILGGPMMAVAVVGLVVNLFVAWRLYGDAHSLNTRAALLHVLGDLLGSVGAILAGGLILAFDWTWADPAISVLIAVLLLIGSVRVLREVTVVLMQGIPSNIDLDRLRARIEDVDGVSDIHDLHVWSLRPGDEVVTVHVVLCEGAQAAQTCAAVRDGITAVVPSAHVTVQPETEQVSCT